VHSLGHAWGLAYCQAELCLDLANATPSMPRAWYITKLSASSLDMLIFSKVYTFKSFLIWCFFLYIYKDILITTWFIKKCSLLCLSPTIHKQPRLLDHEGVLSFPLWIISCFLYLKSCWNWFIKCIMDFLKHWIIYKAHSHVSQNHVGFCNSTWIL